MKFAIDRSSAMEAVKLCSAVIRGSSTLPVLSCVLIQAKGEEITFLSSDLDRWIECRVPAKIEKPGTVALNARLLSAILAKGEAPEVSITIDGKLKAQVKCGGSSYSFPGITAAEFPEIPEEPTLESLEMSADDWLSAARSVAWAASNEPTRMTLCGTLVTQQNGNLLLVATDGKRLAQTLTDTPGMNRDAIIPTDTMKILNSITSTGDVLFFSLGDSMIVATCGTSKVVSKLIEGFYPNYRQVIPNREGQRNLTHIQIPARAFLESIERVSFMVSDGRPGVTISVTEDHTTLSVDGTDNTSKTSIAAEAKGPNQKLCASAQFLAEPFRNWDADTIEMEIEDSMSPVMLRAGANQYVLMPIRVQG